MRALITGSAGFIGRHLAPAMVKHDYEVWGVDPRGNGTTTAHKTWGCSWQHWETICYNSPVDVAVHLAANILDLEVRNKSGVHGFDDIALDLSFCKWVQKRPPRQKLVLLSSCAIDSAHEDSYAFCKVALEQFARKLRQHGVPVTVLRPFSGYGPGQSLSYPMSAIIDRALKHEDPLKVWGSGRQIRDWLYIDDLVDAILWATRPEVGFGPYDIGTGVGTDFTRLARLIAQEVGYDPIIAAEINKPEASTRRVADTLPALALGWKAAVPLYMGIRKTVEAMRASAPVQA